jgi:hypothetical protein
VNSGDFSSLTNGPTDNPDYSSQSGLRTYYRKFQNTGASVRDLSYAFAGVGVIEDSGTSVGSNNKFRVFFKLPVLIPLSIPQQYTGKVWIGLDWIFRFYFNNTLKAQEKIRI